MEGPCADSVEKREPASDLAIVVVDSLKRLTPTGRLEKQTHAVRINCNDEGTCDEGASIGPPSDLPQLGDFRAAVFCVKTPKIVQSRAANSSFSQRPNASTCGRPPPRLGRTR